LGCNAIGFVDDIAGAAAGATVMVGISGELVGEMVIGAFDVLVALGIDVGMDTKSVVGDVVGTAVGDIDIGAVIGKFEMLNNVVGAFDTEVGNKVGIYDVSSIVVGEVDPIVDNVDIVVGNNDEEIGDVEDGIITGGFDRGVVVGVKDAVVGVVMGETDVALLETVVGAFDTAVGAKVFRNVGIIGTGSITFVGDVETPLLGGAIDVGKIDTVVGANDIIVVVGVDDEDIITGSDVIDVDDVGTFDAAVDVVGIDVGNGDDVVLGTGSILDGEVVEPLLLLDGVNDDDIVVTVGEVDIVVGNIDDKGRVDIKDDDDGIIVGDCDKGVEVIWEVGLYVGTIVGNIDILVGDDEIVVGNIVCGRDEGIIVNFGIVEGVDTIGTAIGFGDANDGLLLSFFNDGNCVGIIPGTVGRMTLVGVTPEVGVKTTIGLDGILLVVGSDTDGVVIDMGEEGILLFVGTDTVDGGTTIEGILLLLGCDEDGGCTMITMGLEVGLLLLLFGGDI
jgi:hypothetical protein